MNKKLLEAINKQINSEFYSAYLYLSMAAYFDLINLKGFAHWMKVQVKEETSHGMKLYEFLSGKEEKVVLEQIVKPPANFSSAQDVFKKTLEHEKKVTALIDKLSSLANKVGDTAAANMLQWFIAEQVEEEESASNLLEKLKLVKPDSAALVMLDAQLGKRK